MEINDKDVIGPETWLTISSVFAEALELPISKRDGFLRDACAGSDQLEIEVRRLLSEHDRAGQFLETPALSEAPEACAETDRICHAGDLLMGRFHVVRLLGAGGMGEVYEAFDSELRQSVAIKTLRSPYAHDPAMVERFRAEVLRSRQITHRNVARVHDLFTHRTDDGFEIPFFTMVLIEGETLSQWLSARGPFSPEEALPLLEEMAAALHAAHGAGIVHRDFKPGNVFISRSADGKPHATVTDFGIAAESGSISDAVSSPTTGAGTTLLAGTPAYMAPEQLAGERSSPAADVYALGLVAYEMLTGERAYSAASPFLCALQKTAADDPKLCANRSEIPARWANAIDRSVRREPAERFTDSLEFITAVGGNVGTARHPLARTVWFAALLILSLLSVCAFFLARRAPAAKTHVTAIAVLPFDNAGGEQAYLGEGIAEGLIRGLSSFPNVRVAAQSAASEYKSRRLPPQEIAKSLNVETMLTGSLSQSGHRLHILTRLVDGATGKQLWWHSYDCDAEQLLTVQREITQKLAASLSLGKPSPKAAAPPTSNAEAYDLFLQGRYLGKMRTREKLERSLDYFAQAIGLDGNFGLAYTEIAESNEMLFEYGWISRSDAQPKMQTALQRARALNPDDAQTQACLALFNNRMEWNQVEAEQAFLRALSLDPNLPEAHHWYASYLWRAARFDEALREAQEARRLDPVTLPTLLALAWVRYGRREYPQAIEICKQALELNPSYSPAYQLMAQSYAASGQTEQALAASAETQRLDTDRGVALRHRALVLSRLSGYEDQARQTAAELETVSQDRQAGYLARIYGGLHDREKMYVWADRAIQLHDIGLLEANVDPALDSFRAEPRFQEILRTLGYR